LLIPLGVIFLIVLNLVTRRYEEEWPEDTVGQSLKH
jgi:hypothetical protein